MRFGMRFSAFTAGICVGLLVNMLLAPMARACGMQPADPGDPPQPIQEWDQDDIVDVNTQVYESLFPGETWDSASEMKFAGRMIVEGQNIGSNDLGQEVRLQAFVVDEFDLSGLEASLSADEQALWESGGVRAAIFLGLVSSPQAGFGVFVPVVGCAYSSNVYPETKIIFTMILDESTKDALRKLWLHRSLLELEGGTESIGGEWPNPCCPDEGLSVLELGGQTVDCDQVRASCSDEYDGNVRIAVAGYKAVWATAGTGCIVGTILLASFCIVGNPLACTGLGLWGRRCAVILGTATATLYGALIAAQIAFEMCLGDCPLYDCGVIGCP